MQALSIIVPNSFGDSLNESLLTSHPQRIFNVPGPGEYTLNSLVPVVPNGILVAPIAMLNFSRLVVKTGTEGRRYVCQRLMRASTDTEVTLAGYPGSFPVIHSVTKNPQGGAEASQ